MQNALTMNRFIFHSLRRLLGSWVKTQVRNASLDSLGITPDQPVCYVFRNRSLSDLLVLENECIRAGLPRPSQTIACASPGQEPAFFYLSQQDGLIFQRERPGRSTTLEHLLRWVEGNPEQDIQIVPVSIFWGRTPEKEQSALKLLFDWNFSLGGRFRKFLATLVHGRNTLVHLNPALSLRAISDQGQSHAHTLRKVGRILRVHFRQQRTSVIGPDLSHRRMLVNGLIHSPAIQRAIKAEARSQLISHEEAEYKARKYANEIASDYSSYAIKLLGSLLSWFWNKLYSGVNIHNIEPLKELAKTHTLVYVPCHRSHIDYLLLSYVLYHEGLTPPHIAAGINLNMPVVGTILRKSGAFFMRRTFRSNPLYSSVFHEYMHTLASRGFPLEYFVEGGRSRTGRTLSPKTGMLSISLRSYLRDHRKPVSFIPVYIGYEKLLEVGTYLNELRGKRKKKESPLDILKTLATLKKHFGKAWINFGEPIAMGSFLDQQVPRWQDNTGAPQFKPEWLKGATNQLAAKIAERINSAAIINPVNLVAMALLSAPRHALGEQELHLQLESYCRLLRRMPYSSRTIITPLDSHEMIHHAQALGLVSRLSDSLGNIFKLENSTAIQMTYYRNNILHIFAIPSLISCLLVNTASVSRREVLRICAILYPYLKAELFIEWPARAFLRVVCRWLQAMDEEGLISQRQGVYYRPDTASIPFVMLTVLSRAIIPTLERFYMTISLLIRSGSCTIEQATLENQARDLAQRLSIIHGLNAPEFSDPSLFRGFIEQLRQQQVIDIAPDNTLVFGAEVQHVTEQAFKVLNSEIRHSIHQASHSAAALENRSALQKLQKKVG